MKTFETWPAVRAHAAAGLPIWYHAPLDRYPVRVTVARIYKNGKIRVRPPAGSDADAFTADAGHLDRFRRQ